MERINHMVNNRLEMWAIDAKYLERTEFYFKVQGDIDGIICAMIWISNCNVDEERKIFEIFNTLRKDLDAWYYHID